MNTLEDAGMDRCQTSPHSGRDRRMTRPGLGLVDQHCPRHPSRSGAFAQGPCSLRAYLLSGASRILLVGGQIVSSLSLSLSLTHTHTHTHFSVLPYPSLSVSLASAHLSLTLALSVCLSLSLSRSRSHIRSHFLCARSNTDVMLLSARAPKQTLCLCAREAFAHTRDCSGGRGRIFNTRTQCHEGGEREGCGGE